MKCLIHPCIQSQVLTSSHANDSLSQVLLRKRHHVEERHHLGNPQRYALAEACTITKKIVKPATRVAKRLLSLTEITFLREAERLSKTFKDFLTLSVAMLFLAVGCSSAALKRTLRNRVSPILLSQMLKGLSWAQKFLIIKLEEAAAEAQNACQSTGSSDRP